MASRRSWEVQEYKCPFCPGTFSGRNDQENHINYRCKNNPKSSQDDDNKKAAKEDKARREKEKRDKEERDEEEKRRRGRRTGSGITKVKRFKVPYPIDKKSRRITRKASWLAAKYLEKKSKKKGRPRNGSASEFLRNRYLIRAK